MKKTLFAALATATLAFSASAFAAKPTSITFESEGTTADGREYANYIVRCSNGELQPMTAWDQRREWCVGRESQDNCHRRQIRAATEACRGG